MTEKLEGRIKKGETRNPGGMTKEQRAARDLLNADLRKPGMYKAWLVAYQAQLEEGNVVILKDYADRIGGKVKEHVELSGDPDAPVSALPGLSLQELQAIARAQLAAEAKPESLQDAPPVK